MWLGERIGPHQDKIKPSCTRQSRRLGPGDGLRGRAARRTKWPWGEGRGIYLQCEFSATECGVHRHDPEVPGPGVKPWLLRAPDGWLWKGHLKLSLSFPSCQTGMIKIPTL